MDRNAIEWLNKFSTGGLEPDMYVLLDLSVEESLKRMQMRGQEADRFEREEQEFHERVREAYLELAENDNAKRWLVLSASDHPDTLLKKLMTVLLDRKWLV